MSSLALYRRLLRYVAPYWRIFALSILALIVVAATEPALPALMKPMLDGTFVRRDPAWIHLIPVLIIVVFSIRGMATWLSSYASSWVGNKVVMDLRAAMFRKIVTLPTAYFDHNATGNLISKLTFDTSQVTDAATSVLTVVLKDSLVIAGLLGWLLYLNWKLTLLALVMGPVIGVLVRAISRRLRIASVETQRAMGDITQVIEEAIECHKVVKLFGGQDYEQQRFRDTTNRARGFMMKQASAAALNAPLTQMIAAIALAVIVYLATLQSAADETTVGGFVSFIVAMLMLTAPLKRLTGVNEYLQRGLAAAESVFALIDQPAEPDGGTLDIGRVRGELRFEHVGFCYPETARSALNDISLSIAPGETVALVGASGSGKTTLANLIPRFYSPDCGRILLDGADIQSIQLASLRANIALVSQEVVLFNDTVAANIAYGQMKPASTTAIIAAAEAAHAMDFIADMPQGLQTLVGENGVRLSGGQRQRLAIARALLKNAPLLILDEATSALDSVSERHVQAALETLMRGRTTLVIAHRLSTIERADRIVVLQNGAIAEIGNHRELLRKSGVYAKLHRTQFEREPA